MKIMASRAGLEPAAPDVPGAMFQARVVATRRVKLPGSERPPPGNGVGALSDDEIIEVPVILKPKSPVEIPRPDEPPC